MIKYFEKRQQVTKNTFPQMRIPGQSRTFLKIYQKSSTFFKSRPFQDFPGPWLQWDNTYESSGSQFFRATTEIQPGQVTSEESRSIMTFLTKSRITGILCSLILTLEGKAGEQIPQSSRLEFIEKFQQTFLRCRRQHLNVIQLNRGSTAVLSLLRTLLANFQVVTAKFLGVVLFFY